MARVRAGAFYLACLAFLALAAMAFAEPLGYVLGAWSSDYVAAGHRIHHLMIGASLWVLVLGVGAQLYRPTRRIGALYAALAMWALLTVVLLIVGGFDAGMAIIFAILLVIATLHPAGRDLLPGGDRFDRRAAALVALAAAPLVVFAVGQLGLQATAVDDHAIFGHYAAMAAIGLLIVALGLIASLRPDGWRFPAYAAAALASLIGLASLVFPGTEQGLGLDALWGGAAILWGLAFVAVTEYGARTEPGDER